MHNFQIHKWIPPSFINNNIYILIIFRDQRYDVETLIKKHEDFDKAISSQQEKLNALNQFANQLVSADHYAAPAVTSKRDQIFDRWDRLKAALIEKRSKLGESQTLQQFSRDADEVENWMAEKFQIAQEESYRDPTNIQQKHQKQQAFEAELSANADRIATLISAGQNLIHHAKCAGGEGAVSHRLKQLNDQWYSFDSIVENIFIVTLAPCLLQYV